jgi:ribosome maturation factor RimP
MTTARQRIQHRVCELASPIVANLGLDLVDVEFSRQGGSQLLRIFLDRDGGVSLDELQEASRSLERSLEIEDILSGRYRLEVSSPGIDRPLKGRNDYFKRTGTRIQIKMFSPLHDGRRRLTGTIVDAREESLLLETDEGARLTIPYREISSARPEVDWDALLKKSPAPLPDGAKSRGETS